MTGVRTLAWGLFLVAALGTFAEAAPLRSRSGWWWWWQQNSAAVNTSTRQVADTTVAAASPSTSSSYNTMMTSSGPVVTSLASSPDNVVTNYPDSSPPVFYANLIPPSSAPPSYQYDALVNMGDGPYAAADSLTTGGAQPWYLSPVVDRVFGHVPTPDERAAFTSAVLQRVEQTYAQSGLPISLTSNPLDSAAHSLSVVSNTSFGPNPDAIGITNMGGDGFGFIDKLGYANSVDELEWAVAHNVAHELMHAFDVDHHDTTGQYLDAAVSSWSVLTDPNARFGPDAVADLMTKNFSQRYTGFDLTGAELLRHDTGTMMLGPTPVPEPTTLALWGVAGIGTFAVHRSRSRRPRPRKAA